MARSIRDDLDKFFDYQIYLPTRTIYIGSAENDMEDGESGTDAAMAERAVKSLHVLDSVAPLGDKPITIYMNNPGGSVKSGFAIYDAIKACKNHVTMKCLGECSSMATIILQAADSRILSQHITFMIHSGTTAFSEDHIKNVKNAMKWDEMLDEYTVNIYLEKIRQKHPEFTRQQLNNKLQFDTFLTAQEAVDLGLADSILE